MLNKKQNKKVFLGGTCNGSLWRDTMQSYLDSYGLKYFNPVVDDWTEEDRKKEIRERKTCDFVLYTITPKMKGVYSIAEVVDDSNKRPDKTILVILNTDDKDTFSKEQEKSLDSVAKMVVRNGGQVFFNLKIAAKWIANV